MAWSVPCHDPNKCLYTCRWISVKFEWKYNTCRTRKCIRKCRLQIGGHLSWSRCVNDACMKLCLLGSTLLISSKHGRSPCNWFQSMYVQWQIPGMPTETYYFWHQPWHLSMIKHTLSSVVFIFSDAYKFQLIRFDLYIQNVVLSWPSLCPFQSIVSWNTCSLKSLSWLKIKSPGTVNGILWEN